jgi:DNA-binding CsgD family transcriptional regulator
MRRLAPHLGRAARLRLQLKEDGTLPRWASAALAGLPFGLLLLNGARRVIYANRAGLRLLEAEDGLRIHRKELVAAVSGADRELRGLLARATAPANGEPPAVGDIALPRAEGRPLALSVVPLPRSSFADLTAPAMLVYVLVPELKLDGIESRLAALMKITLAEARVARALLEGSSVAEAAAQFNVAEATVRTQLRALFTKTDNRRQPDLLRLLTMLSMLPPTDLASD